MTNTSLFSRNTSQAVDNLITEGINVFGDILEKDAASNVYNKVRSIREFGSNLFLTEAEYESNPQHFGVNPREGFNLIESFSSDIGFIEQNKSITETLNIMLGKDYKIHNKKFVCGVPYSWLPEYLKIKMKKASINNLGAYIRPEYRDITYFHGIDFHQDIIDWPSWKPEKKTHNFLTLYVYIHPVTQQDAPLYVMPKTHQFGATQFPHQIRKVDENKNVWHYMDGRGHEMTSNHLVLTGNTGYAAIWHSCLIHGTQNISESSKDCRISIRYIIQRGTSSSTVQIDKLNASINGPLFLERAREDLNDKGQVVLLSNTIREINNEKK